MNNKSAKYIIKKFNVIGDRRLAFPSRQLEAHQRLSEHQYYPEGEKEHFQKLLTRFAS